MTISSSKPFLKQQNITDIQLEESSLNPACPFLLHFYRKLNTIPTQMADLIASAVLSTAEKLRTTELEEWKADDWSSLRRREGIREEEELKEL